MALWVDAFRPKELTELSIHKDKASYLKNLIMGDDFPHLMFYGPSGAGKKTLVSCLLREFYGDSFDNQKLETGNFENSSGKKIEISMLSSNYHLEINASDAGIYDRIVIQDLIKETAQSGQLNSVKQKKFKVIILNDADKLTKDAQHALRRTMEKYSSTCRIILLSTCISKIIQPLQSRCLGIRVGAPSLDQIIPILHSVSQKNDYSVSSSFLQNIAVASKRNLRRALLILETCYVNKNENIEMPSWELFLKRIADQMIEEQSAKRILECRTSIYELLSHCIPADTIMKNLLIHVLDKSDSSIKNNIIQAAANYSSHVSYTNKPIFHIEAFIAFFMYQYNKYVLESIC